MTDEAPDEQLRQNVQEGIAEFGFTLIENEEDMLERFSKKMLMYVFRCTSNTLTHEK